MIAKVSSALIAIFIASPVQPQTSEPADIAFGPHPQIVQHWQASYRFDCGELTVSVDLAVAEGKATVSAIDLGRGPVVEKLGELNAALEADYFRDLSVTCTRTDPFPHVMFRTYATNAEGGETPAAISIEATGREPSDVRLVRR